MPHPNDRELLMASDGELPARRLAAIRGHLASCRSCRERMNRVQIALLDFVRLHDSEFDSRIPPISGSRDALRARLGALTAESERSFSSRVLGRFRTRRSYELAGAALLAVLTVTLATRFGSSPLLETAAVPKPQLTPGATVPVTKQQVCGSAPFTRGPMVSASLARQVFAAYGITNPGRNAYEIDYLITPDLGGAANIRNLWPQPYYNTAWTASVKDQLEERLHSMVCSGEIDVATAQHDLAADWIGAYKKYFHTDRPRFDHPRERTRFREGYLPAEELSPLAARAAPPNAPFMRRLTGVDYDPVT